MPINDVFRLTGAAEERQFRSNDPAADGIGQGIQGATSNCTTPLESARLPRLLPPRGRRVG